MEMLVASVEDQESVTDWPAQIVPGDAVMATDTGSHATACTGSWPAMSAIPMSATVATAPTPFRV
jgi:hypothetical protein